MRFSGRLAQTACAGVAALLLGCRAPLSELSPPAEWHLTGAEPVAVASADAVLPIVTEDLPESRWAAAHLADVIRRTCGIRPDVLVEFAGQTNNWKRGLFVGAVSANRGYGCPLSAKHPEAFRVVSGDGAVRFLGRADYAVFDWCERELDFRNYGPGWKCAARREAIVARALDYSDAPAFACRRLGNSSEPWLRAAKAGSSHRGGTAVHQPREWHLDARIRAAHPEIFETGDTPMLCYGNPATLEYYCERIDRHIRGLEDSGGIVCTNRKVVSVSQWDAPIRCRCPYCRGLYAPAAGFAGKASPVLWGAFLPPLAEWLAKTHPDYMISFLPYLDTCKVPGTDRIGGLAALGNCEAEVCTMPGLALFKEPECRRTEERIIRDWRRATGRKVLNWHYSCWPADHTSAPYVFGREVRAHYARMRGEIAGSYVCGDAGDRRLALSHYVWMRCLWNPDVDVDAIYNGFARRMFGAAAAPMRRLIGMQERCWNRRWKLDDRPSNNWLTAENIFGRSFPREDVVRMLELLREADALARESGDAEARRRIAEYAAGMEPFLSEFAALAKRNGRRRIRVGATNEMVAARSVRHPRPWARTAVSAHFAGDRLRFRVECFDPAAAGMDFARRDRNFAWGEDCVSFVCGDGKRTETFTVYANGEIERAGDGRRFSAKVVPPDGDASPDCWTVVAEVGLAPDELARRSLLANVCRWRVGDRRREPEARAPGSRYEQSRLNTCYTFPNDDPAALAEICW